jgi:hypothetical protein
LTKPCQDTYLNLFVFRLILRVIQLLLCKWAGHSIIIELRILAILAALQCTLADRHGDASASFVVCQLQLLT